VLSFQPAVSAQFSAAVDTTLGFLWRWLGETKRVQGATSLRRYVAPDSLESLRADDMRWTTWSRREQLAWAAGFFDGEGCFSYSQSSGSGCVAITQTDRRLLDCFRGIVGFGKVYAPYKNRAEDGFKRKPPFFYRATGHQLVQATAAMLLFKLTKVKKIQAVEFLARIRARSHCANGHELRNKPGGCPRCVADFWQEYREGRATRLGMRAKALRAE